MANLLLFNMKMDANDDVLGFATDWVNELACHFDQVFVVTHTAGKILVKENVHVFSVGREKGYSELRRAFEFYRIVINILKRHRIDFCFVHMIQVFAILAAPLMKWKRIPIVMWYGHKATPLSLHIAHFLVDKVVTSTDAGFQIKSAKKVVVGQGITESKFSMRPFKRREKPFNVLSIARITEIKHLHVLVEAVGMFAQEHGNDSIKLLFVGDAMSSKDRSYKSSLQEIIRKYSIENCVEFHGAIPHSRVSSYLSSSDLSVNLAPDGAIDKAALESMASGIPVLVQNHSFCALFEEAGIPSERYVVPDIQPATIATYLKRLAYSAHQAEEYDHLKTLSRHVLANHGLTGLAMRISNVIFTSSSNCNSRKPPFAP